MASPSQSSIQENAPTRSARLSSAPFESKGGTRKEVEQKEKAQPWKYIGYKVFSRWMASDQSFFIMRRFGTLSARIALSLQDEIVQLEEKLNFMDKEYSSMELLDDVNNGSFRDDPFGNIKDDRGELVREILPGKLANYRTYVPAYYAKPLLTS
jgi:hypothetical protein